MEYPDFSQHTILIVEDDPVSTLFLKDVLEDTGARVLDVDNASDAIFTVHQNCDIDLVLMDIQLPDMSGWQATRIIKKVKKNLPIIFQSAYAFDSYVKKSMEAGGDFFIPKPIDTDLLFDYMKQAFAKYQQQ
jgi:CheY-like chemotaxis protein